MKDKLEPGDLAIVINSLKNEAVGKIVACISMDGIHSQYGRIWLVQSASPMSVMGGDVLRKAHIPEDWLKKIPKDPLPDESDDITIDDHNEITA